MHFCNLKPKINDTDNCNHYTHQQNKNDDRYENKYIWINFRIDNFKNRRNNIFFNLKFGVIFLQFRNHGSHNNFHNLVEATICIYVLTQW